MNRSLTGIIFDRNLPTLLLLFIIFKHMCLNKFSDEYNPLLNEVQLMVSEVLMFHENIELLPSGDSYDISPGNNETTKHIKFYLVGIPTINKLVLVEAVKDY